MKKSVNTSKSTKTVKSEDLLKTISKLNSRIEILTKSFENNFLSSPQLKQKLIYYKIAFLTEKERNIKLTKSLQTQEHIKSVMIRTFQDLKDPENELHSKFFPEIKSLQREINFLNSISYQLESEEKDKSLSWNTIKNLVDLDESIAILYNDIFPLLQNNSRSLNVLDSLSTTLQISLQEYVFPNRNPLVKFMGSNFHKRKDEESKDNPEQNNRSNKTISRLYYFTSNLQNKATEYINTFEQLIESESKVEFDIPINSHKQSNLQQFIQIQHKLRNFGLTIGHICLGNMIKLEQFVKDSLNKIYCTIETKILNEISEILDFYEIQKKRLPEPQFLSALSDLLQLKFLPLRKVISKLHPYTKENENSILDFIHTMIEEMKSVIF